MVGTKFSQNRIGGAIKQENKELPKRVKHNQNSNKGLSVKQKIKQGIELIKVLREDNVFGADDELWLFMVENYVALHAKKLTKKQIDTLDKIAPDWIKHTEKEILSFVAKFKKTAA